MDSAPAPPVRVVEQTPQKVTEERVSENKSGSSGSSSGIFGDVESFLEDVEDVFTGKYFRQINLEVEMDKIVHEARYVKYWPYKLLFHSVIFKL